MCSCSSPVPSVRAKFSAREAARLRSCSRCSRHPPQMASPALGVLHASSRCRPALKHAEAKQMKGMRFSLPAAGLPEKSLPAPAVFIASLPADPKVTSQRGEERAGVPARGCRVPGAVLQGPGQPSAASCSL